MLCVTAIPTICCPKGEVYPQKKHKGILKRTKHFEISLFAASQIEFLEKNAFDKMVKLIEEKDFVNLQQAEAELDWKDASIMKF